MWSEWKTKFLQIVDKRAPIRILRALNLRIIRRLRLVSNRDTFKIKAIKSNDPHDWVNFKRMPNKFKKLLTKLSLLDMPHLRNRAATGGVTRGLLKPMTTRVKHVKSSTI